MPSDTKRTANKRSLPPFRVSSSLLFLEETCGPGESVRLGGAGRAPSRSFWSTTGCEEIPGPSAIPRTEKSLLCHCLPE